MPVRRFLRVWGVDADGRETTDPREVKAVLPMAGPKGSGLSLMIEVLGSVLVGYPLIATEHAPSTPPEDDRKTERVRLYQRCIADGIVMRSISSRLQKMIASLIAVGQIAAFTANLLHIHACSRRQTSRQS